MENTDLYIKYKIAKFDINENSPTVQITGTREQNEPNWQQAEMKKFVKSL